MTVFAYLDGTQLATTRIRLKSNGDQGIAGLSANADGDMGQGGIIFEDTASDLTVTGWMAVAVNETDCTSAPRLFTGYVADYHYEHGQHYRLTPERDIDTTINDTNVLLATPILKNGDSPNRPAETDAARVAWLLGTTPMANIHDLGFVQTDTISMDATNYLYSTPADVLNDVCGPRNYIFFTYWDQSAREIGLFIAPPTRNIFTSTLSFSNDPEDITLVNGEPSGTCFPAYMDPTLTVDPSSVYCDIAYRCVGFAVEGHSQTTHDAFFASHDSGNAIPAVGHRGIVLDSSRTGKVATARAAVDNLLIFYGSDRRTATFTTRLPSTKVGLLQAGMLVSLKFRHLPGLTTFTSWRVQTLTVAPTDGDPTHYDLEVTASLSGLAIPAGTGGGTTTGFPPATGTTPGVVQTIDTPTSNSLIPANDWVVGNTMVGFIARRSGGTAFHGTGWTLVDHANGNGNVEPCDIYTRTVVTGDVKNGPGSLGGTTGWFGGGGGDQAWIAELSNGTSITTTHVDAVNFDPNFTSGTVTVSGTALIITGGALGYADSDENIMNSLGTGVTEFSNHDALGGGNRPWLWGGYRTVTTGGSYAVTGTLREEAGVGITGYGYSSATVVLTGGVSAPVGGQPFGPVSPNETPNGSTTVFTLPTGYTFATNSLRVFVDRLDQTSAVTSQDGSAVPATFTLNFAPATGELVEVYGTGV